jgi:opacity protein-like surface antigen
MKSRIKVVAVCLVLAAPVASFAQANQQPVTRSQVRADLIQAENAGYSPLAWADYPYGEIQAAEFRAAAQNAYTSGYGSGSSSTSQSGDIAR